jgi:hypothetical protein
MTRFRHLMIMQLMTLQDKIETLQKLVFWHVRHGTDNQCRLSSLVPLVKESHGIYKFITSMLRGVDTTTTGSKWALARLRQRYEAQYHRLVRFYDECSREAYLTSLTTIPRLPQVWRRLIAHESRCFC